MNKLSLTPTALLVTLAGTALGQSTVPFPTQFQLASLLPANGGDGSTGFIIVGIDTGDESGASVSSAGDVNGDGIDDLIIGASGADPNGKSRAGESYLVFGTPSIGSGGVVNLSSLNGTNGFVLNGIDLQDFSGSAVSSAGDINGDGIGDLIIGANGADPNFQSYAGESYVVFGGVGVGGGGVINLSSLNGLNGFVLNGVTDHDRSGRSVSCAGDVNGDGIDDLIIGADSRYPNGLGYAGASYVVFGAANVGVGGVLELSSLNGTNGFVLNGFVRYGYSGISVSSAGDINGDGISDLVIGAWKARGPTGGRTGESYVVFGAANVGVGGVLELSTLNGTNGFVLKGVNANDRSGKSVSCAGDLNGDGIDDLIIGAYSADPNSIPNSYAGSSYVVFGAAGIGSGGVIQLSSLNGTNGIVLNGDPSDRSGNSVSSAGDINGDGIDDVIIGASAASPNGRFLTGKSVVIFGRDTAINGNFAASINLSSVTGSSGFVLNGIDTYDRSGGSVSSAGDVNGDGIADLIIGASSADPYGNSNAGESYVVFGRANFDTDLDGLPNSWEINGIPYVDENAVSQLLVLDVDGDGLSDADPNHKDLFVEVDVMSTVPFSQAAIGDVIAAFSGAPVSNPDGFTGINLHVVVDETNLLFVSSWDDGFVDFDASKLDHFGTSLERVGALAGSQILIAKAKAYRYCQWVNSYSPSGSVGWGEFPGNDFTVAFASLAPADQTQHFMASMFMHELGHNLNLDHGGLDGINFKPNHMSVMNYAFRWFAAISGVAPLDYCREVIPTLDESNLNELAGIPSVNYQSVFTVFSASPIPPAITVGFARLDGSSVDWNKDGTLQSSVSADINDLNSSSASPSEVMQTENEWELLGLAIGTGGDFVAGQHITLPPSEMDVATVVWLNDNVPSPPMICLGDANGSGVVDFSDITSVLSNWLTDGSLGGDANADGIVNFSDITNVLSNWLVVCP